MSRYAASQLLLAFVLTAVGAVKGARLLLDEIDDATSRLAGLS